MDVKKKLEGMKEKIEKESEISEKFRKRVNEKIGEKFKSFSEELKEHEELLKETASKFKHIKPLLYYAKLNKLTEEETSLLQRYINFVTELSKMLFSSEERNAFFHEEFNQTEALGNIILQKYQGIEKLEPSLLPLVDNN